MPRETEWVNVPGANFNPPNTKRWNYKGAKFNKHNPTILAVRYVVKSEDLQDEMTSEASRNKRGEMEQETAKKFKAHAQKVYDYAGSTPEEKEQKLNAKWSTVKNWLRHKKRYFSDEYAVVTDCFFLDTIEALDENGYPILVLNEAKRYALYNSRNPGWSVELSNEESTFFLTNTHLVGRFGLNAHDMHELIRDMRKTEPLFPKGRIIVATRDVIVQDGPVTIHKDEYYIVSGVLETGEIKLQPGNGTELDAWLTLQEQSGFKQCRSYGDHVPREKPKTKPIATPVKISAGCNITSQSSQNANDTSLIIDNESTIPSPNVTMGAAEMEACTLPPLENQNSNMSISSQETEPRNLDVPVIGMYYVAVDQTTTTGVEWYTADARDIDAGSTLLITEVIEYYRDGKKKFRGKILQMDDFITIQDDQGMYMIPVAIQEYIEENQSITVSEVMSIYGQAYTGANLHFFQKIIKDILEKIEFDDLFSDL